MKQTSSRCALMVSAGTYRAAGQCAKRHGLRRTPLADGRLIPACAHHRAVLAQAGVVPRVVGR